MSAAATAHTRDPQALSIVFLHRVLVHLHRALAAWTGYASSMRLHDTRRRDLDGALGGATRLEQLQLSHLAIEAFWRCSALDQGRCSAAHPAKLPRQQPEGDQ